LAARAEVKPLAIITVTRSLTRSAANASRRSNPPSAHCCSIARLRPHTCFQPILYIVDMLRNEKPVYFVFNDSNQAGSLHTGWEPTGEAE
jgi:hypothetical protein